MFSKRVFCFRKESSDSEKESSACKQNFVLLKESLVLLKEVFLVCFWVARVHVCNHFFVGQHGFIAFFLISSKNVLGALKSFLEDGRNFLIR